MQDPYARRRRAVMLAAIAVAAVPQAAHAADDEDLPAHDARLDGLTHRDEKIIDTTQVTGSTAVTWLLMVLLAAMILGVMFKNAKRTHLD